MDLNGMKLKAFQGGLEQQLVDFLSSGSVMPLQMTSY